MWKSGKREAIRLFFPVQLYAGFSGILIEDQEAPKACGHVGERRVVNKGNAIQKVRAASDARDEGADVLIFARTDARGPEGIQGAVERAQAYAKEGGADVVFADALRAEPEIEQFAKAQSVPVLANMLEGGGKTPVLPPEHLERLGVNIAAYPLSLLGVYITAVQRVRFLPFSSARLFLSASSKSITVCIYPFFFFF